LTTPAVSLTNALAVLVSHFCSSLVAPASSQPTPGTKLSICPSMFWTRVVASPDVLQSPPE